MTPIDKIKFESDLISLIDDEMLLLNDMRKWLDTNSKEHFLYKIIEKRYNFIYRRVEELCEKHENMSSNSVKKKEDKKDDGEKNK